MKKRMNLAKPKFLEIPDIISTEIIELNTRYKLRTIKEKNWFKIVNLHIAFLRK